MHGRKCKIFKRFLRSRRRCLLSPSRRATQVLSCARMPVKALVSLFETSPSEASPVSPVPPRALRAQQSTERGHTFTRFTTRPKESHGFRPTDPFADSKDVTDELPRSSRSSTLREDLSYKPNPDTYPSSTYKYSDSDTLITSSYPPSNGGAPRRSFSSTSTLVRRHPRHPHASVPATVVFHRNAAKLHLPRLDNYITSLEMPAFTAPVQPPMKEPDMFTPMDRLAATGKSLEDLETSSVIKPGWRDRKTIFGGINNALLGVTGSSALAAFYSLQGLMNTVQVFALILGTIVPRRGLDTNTAWRKVILGTVPNVLALNFGTTLIQSLIFLTVFMTLAAGLLFYFRRSISHCDRYNSVEGLQSPEERSSRWGILLTSFLLTVIYLPLSTLSIHVLVWSDDLWVTPNPYKSAKIFPLQLEPLGAPEEFRGALDFCWTTTMKRNEVNFAPVFIIIAAFTFLTLTIWFPLTLRRVIKQSVPRVDPFTEQGRRRTRSDMDREYQRLLARDKNPFAFLYKNFRRDWGQYEATYLFAKLSTLFIIAVISPDNCFFRTLPRTTITLVSQILLLCSTVGFFLLQSFLAPFLAPLNNASEWVSRLNYVLTTALALCLTMDVPGQEVLAEVVVYIVYVLTYGLSIYFTIIDTSFMRRVVKRTARRIDFSIDIFSPRLDTSPYSAHTRRRIWQESITTLFLTSPECGIPAKQQMLFAQARDSEYPPYLLEFAGSPGERHVENLKILREVGYFVYTKGVSLVSGPDYAWFRYLEEEIQRHFVGPDCYWKAPNEEIRGCTSHFGNAWWIPFPPTLTIRYDDGPLCVLQDVADLEAYITQNTSQRIRRRREIRMSIRALDGQTVAWPYDHIEAVGSESSWFRGRRYQAQHAVSYQRCVLRIHHRGHQPFNGLALGSGFRVELTYGKKIRMDGGLIGLTDDYDLTSPLARFLTMNQHLIPTKLQHIEGILGRYRDHHRRECQMKRHVLSYSFLATVYNQPRDPKGLAESSIANERDNRVRQLMVGSEAVFDAAYERLFAVSTSEAATWWYIFWDDLWRRNYDTIDALQANFQYFNPHYPASVAYTPLTRPALEEFLVKRNLMSVPPRRGDFFHSGFLNKLYLRLNDTAFHRGKQAIMFHVGDNPQEVDMDDVDADMNEAGRPSTLGSGAGTDHDDVSIRARPTYRWEGLLDDPVLTGKRRRRRWFVKMGAWLGLTPLWKTSMASQGVSLDVHLDGKGRYVLMEEEDEGSLNIGSSQGLRKL